jgi:DNA-binding transcriptional LysR family regulator
MDLHDRVGRRLKLRDLRLLMAVAESGSMAKAAAHINLTQSAVSRAIGELEHTLGVRLFDRTPQGVEPTIYGRALLKGGVAVFDDLRTSISEIEYLSDPTAGELRIGATEGLGAGLLPPLIDHLARQYPRLTFDLVLGDAASLQERDLRGRRIDLAIMRPVAPTLVEDLEETILYKDRLRVVAGAESHWASRRKVTLADLVTERWCLPPPDHPVGALVIGAFRRCGLEPPRRTVTVGSAQWTSNLVAKGQLLGVHGEAYLRFKPGHVPLKVLPVDLRIPWSPVSIITLKSRTLSPVAQLFINRALELMKPMTKLG